MYPFSYSHPIGAPFRRTGFTLVELLVAMSVLVLLIMLVVQLVNSASIATSTSDKQLDADAQAQIVFSQMGKDFSAMPQRKDLDCFFWKNTAPGQTGGWNNDLFFFYSETAGYYSGAAGSSQNQ